MEYKRKAHSVYSMTYHMVFVTKYRKPVISDEIGDYMQATWRRTDIRGIRCRPPSFAYIHTAARKAVRYDSGIKDTDIKEGALNSGI